MTDAARIRALREKVESGECPMWTQITGAIGLHPDNRHLSFYGAFHGSLDAAKALHEALLCSVDPQYGYLVGPQYARIVHPSCGTVCDATAATPARAWLIAILRALEEEAKG